MRPPLRVLMLSRSYPSDLFPNLGLWVERPTALLNEHPGVDVTVVSPQPYCPPFPDIPPLSHYTRFRRIPRRERLHGVDVLRPRYLAGPGHWTYRFESRAYALGIRREVDRLHAEFPFDLVHAHFIYPEGAAAHRLSRRWEVPFVVSEHAPWLPGWFERKTVRNECMAAGRAAAALLPDSEYVRRSIEEWIGDATTLVTVPEGVDGELFAPSEDDGYLDDQILFVGWPNFNKGVDVLLRAVSLLAKRGAPGRLLIVGGGYYRSTRRMESQLRELAGSLDLAERVTFAGPKPQEEVARLMAQSAVVVLPSRLEAFGAVLVEALACGTPVVATRCGGPEDIVSPEVGLLVPVEDPPALADALAAILGDRRRFAPDRLRQYALERFGWPRIVDGWLEAYAGALARPVADLQVVDRLASERADDAEVSSA